MKKYLIISLLALLSTGLISCASGKKNSEGKTATERRKEKETAKREEEKKGEVKAKEKQTTPATDYRSRTLDRPLENK